MYINLNTTITIIIESGQKTPDLSNVSHCHGTMTLMHVSTLTRVSGHLGIVNIKTELMIKVPKNWF